MTHEVAQGPQQRNARLPTIAVAIPTYLREEALVDTIRSVLAQDPPADEVLVVDQTPQHLAETEQFLSQAHDRGDIRWIRHSPPNPSAARNRAVSETRCEVVLFLDDDVLLGPGMIERHRRHFLRPEIHLVQGQAHQRLAPLDRISLDRPQVGTEAVLHGGCGWGSRCTAVACNLSVRVSTYRQTQGFDENFTLYHEESDFLLRSGQRCWDDPEAFVLHLRYPGGGSRIAGRRHTPEWAKSMTCYLVTFRHGRKTGPWAVGVWMGLRAGPLRRENVLRPWRWPGAWAHAIYAAWEGWKRAAAPVRSPFAKNENP